MTEFPNWFNITAKENFENILLKEAINDSDAYALQIGAFTGDATQWLHDNTSWGIHDVDTWRGSEETEHETMDFNKVRETYEERHADKFMRLTDYMMTSDEFFSEPLVVEYDFIYIDGDHTATQTVKDGLNAFPYLKSGGIIAFDDFTWQSGKGGYYDPSRGIQAFHHICQDMVELIVANSQAWFRKL